MLKNNPTMAAQMRANDAGMYRAAKGSKGQGGVRNSAGTTTGISPARKRARISAGDGSGSGGGGGGGGERGEWKPKRKAQGPGVVLAELSD